VRKMRRCLRIPFDKDKNDMEAAGYSVIVASQVPPSLLQEIRAK